MRPSHLAETLEAILRCRQSAYVQSAPGLGKSSLCFQVASRIFDGATVQSTVGGVPDVDWYIGLRGVDMDPVDLRGIPYTTDGATHWAAPALVAKLGDKGGVICIDELPQSTPAVQCVLRELLLDRRIGGVRIPDSWSVVATGNRQQDRAGANRLLSHVASAVVMLDLEASHEDWQRWAIQAGIAPHVRAFINFRPGLLHDFDPARDRNADPRAWERLSKIVDFVPDHSRLAVASGCVGDGAAAEYLSFRKMYLELPDPDSVLKEAATIEIPEDPSVCCALIGALTERIKTASKGVMESYATFAVRLKKAYAVLALRDGLAVQPQLATVPAVTKWVMANPNVFGEK